MTDIAEAKGTSLVDEFRSLKPKQLAGLVAALVVSLVLEVLGFGVGIIGLMIIAIILYMVPHLLGVESVRIKAILGVTFVVLALLLGTFMFSNIHHDAAGSIDRDTDKIKDVEYVDGMLTAVLIYPEGQTPEPYVTYGKVDGIPFGHIFASKMSEKIPMVAGPSMDSGVRYSAEIPLEDNSFNVVVLHWNDSTYLQFTVDTGVSDEEVRNMCMEGSLYITMYSAAIFFLILVFSALMRRSINKTRTKMEEQGRLYPQGYGRCKECNAIVLPGEITCRKCGTYIDVPDELRAEKKDYFVCTDCGSEVPRDANSCPKCGARFDSDAEEFEVRHEDGTVDVGTEVFVCSDCGEKVPVNAKRCPKCGASFDEE